MPGTITPLPVMLDDADRKTYEELEPPKTIVVKYGYLRQIAELKHDGQQKPGCGSKLVIRTQRGIELAELVTVTCSNAGCGSSISRKQMLDYIDRSGGKNYPFTTNGKVMRVATPEDLIEQDRLDAQKPAMIKFTKNMIAEMDLPMQLVDIELLLGGERAIFHYTADQWVDFRDLVRLLAREFQTRIEMHQVNARDEARIVADYEKCGQHCCCRQFLKVLKPVSMRSAKVQKATLDPHKISGRCGRLMCCLRYEDQTYEHLRKKLPRKQTPVKTEDGEGVVLDTQILTQLVLVRLDATNRINAYPLEHLEILKPQPNQGDGEGKKKRKKKKKRTDGEGPQDDARSGESRGGESRSGDSPSGRSRDGGAGEGRPAKQPRRPKPGQPLTGNEIESREGKPAREPDRWARSPSPTSDQGSAPAGDAQAEAPATPAAGQGEDASNPPAGEHQSSGGDQAATDNQPPADTGDRQDPQAGQSDQGAPRKKRRRRRRPGKGGGGQGGGAPSGPKGGGSS